MKPKISRSKPLTYAEDYKNSALKHLQTCDLLLKSIGSGSDLDEQYQENILRNTFYLAGYSIECIINYTILKKTGWKKPAHSLNNTKYEISFGKNFDRYIITSHDFQINMEILDKLIEGSRFKNIPIIGGHLCGYSDTCRRLFFRWMPHERYVTASSPESYFTLIEVQEFIKMCKEIYVQLLMC